MRYILFALSEHIVPFSEDRCSTICFHSSRFALTLHFNQREPIRSGEDEGKNYIKSNAFAVMNKSDIIPGESRAEGSGGGAVMRQKRYEAEQLH